MTEKPSTNAQTPPDDGDELVRAVRIAQARPDLLAGLAELYRKIENEIGDTQQCKACGQCCDFPNFGHRLYASTAELALLIQVSPPAPSAVLHGLCPYQTGKSCAAREQRCLGCRVFFCDLSGITLQSEYIEHLHYEMKKLHERFCTPYLYANVIAAVRQLLVIPEVS